MEPNLEDGGVQLIQQFQQGCGAAKSSNLKPFGQVCTRFPARHTYVK
jgi:hypothetical protein